MNAILARKLISKGAIRQDTVFQAFHNATGLSCQKNSLVEGNFVLVAARGLKDGSIAFDATRAGTTEQVRLLSTDVIGVDGMDLPRFAATYDLNIDGSDMKVGKRRGRRPRAMVEAMRRAEEAAALAAQADAPVAVPAQDAISVSASDAFDAIEDNAQYEWVELDVTTAIAASNATTPFVIIPGSVRPMVQGSDRAASIHAPSVAETTLNA